MRRVHVRILAPYLVGGGLLLAACVLGVGYIDRLDANMTNILADHVSSQLAAKELETAVLQLRYDHLALLAAPARDARERIRADGLVVRNAIEAVAATARTDTETLLVDEIRAAFAGYLLRIAQVPAAVGPNPLAGLGELLPGWGVDELLRPTRELVRVNRGMARTLADDSEQTRRRMRAVLLLVGVVGPLAGLACGYAVARGLGRSIHELSINVSDLSERVGVQGSVKLLTGGGVEHVNEQLREVIDRVREVVAQAHQQERELIRAEQLATVGQLAAMVAHEIRNPLSAVTILVTMATRANNPVPLSAEDLKVISTELARVEQTVQGMLDLARPARSQPVAIDLRDPVRTGLELIRRRASSQRVALDVALPDAPVTIRADRGQLTSVFVNLYMNALDEMKSGGRLDIRVTATDGQVRVTVGDTGPGLAESSTETVFEAFQTSKPTGTGLGLHIARRVVLDHGGSVSASNRPPDQGPGAIFTVTLPAAGPPDGGRRAETTRG